MERALPRETHPRHRVSAGRRVAFAVLSGACAAGAAFVVIATQALGRGGADLVSFIALLLLVGVGAYGAVLALSGRRKVGKPRPAHVLSAADRIWIGLLGAACAACAVWVAATTDANGLSETAVFGRWADVLPWVALLLLVGTSLFCWVLALSGLRKARKPRHVHTLNMAASIAKATGPNGAHPLAQCWPLR